MIKNFKKDTFTQKSQSIGKFHSSNIVYATIQKHHIDSNCPHFISHTSLKCNTCESFHPCIYCHDETPCIEFDCDLIRCETCKTVQKPSKSCVNCKQKFGNFACLECMIFIDNTDEFRIFHSKRSGKCVKGVENEFIFCEKCLKDIEIDFYQSHNCIIQEEDLCCVCHGEFDQIVNFKTVFKCRHYMHQWCWKQVGDKCPLCSKELLFVKGSENIQNEAFLSVLITRSKGEVQELKIFECDVCGSAFQDYLPACCCQAFCRSCEVKEVENCKEFISYQDGREMIRRSGQVQILIFRCQEQVKSIFREKLEKQAFWDQYNEVCDDRMGLFLDYCNLDDALVTWQAVCLLLNKGYNEVDVNSGLGLKKEIEICLAQIGEVQ
ncbi:CHY zinc finger family protein [Spironucleus salmonicida]|nr:CHY zinc finger family protein [Spironucleus salmonicida]